MKSLLRTLAVVTWALWFGGLIALFVFATHMFAVTKPGADGSPPRMERSVAVQANGQLFVVFGRYQLIIGAAALTAVVAWRAVKITAWINAAFVAMGMAALMACYLTAVITPRMDALRVAGESSGPAFKQLHGQSMILFTAEAVDLLVAGALLCAALSVVPDTARRAADSDLPAQQ